MEEWNAVEKPLLEYLKKLEGFTIPRVDVAGKVNKIVKERTALATGAP